MIVAKWNESGAGDQPTQQPQAEPWPRLPVPYDGQIWWGHPLPKIGQGLDGWPTIVEGGAWWTSRRCCGLAEYLGSGTLRHILAVLCGDGHARDLAALSACRVDEAAQIMVRRAMAGRSPVVIDTAPRGDPETIGDELPIGKILATWQPTPEAIAAKRRGLDRLADDAGIMPGSDPADLIRLPHPTLVLVTTCRTLVQFRWIVPPDATSVDRKRS